MHFHAHSPLDENDVTALDARCSLIQFSEPLTPNDHLKIANHLRKFPKTVLRPYGHCSESRDLSFLQYYPSLATLQLTSYQASEPTNLAQLPVSLSRLSITADSTEVIDVARLQELEALTDLHINPRARNLDRLVQFSNLRQLSLARVKDRDLTVIDKLTYLTAFALYSSPVAELRFLSNLANLRRLRLGTLRRLTDVSPLTELRLLESLYLERLPLVKALPNLSQSHELKRVWIEGLKCLTNLEQLAHITELQECAVLNMAHLQENDFLPLQGHRSLKFVYYTSGPFSAALFGRGGHVKQEAIRALLQLGSPKCIAPLRWD